MCSDHLVLLGHPCASWEFRAGHLGIVAALILLVYLFLLAVSKSENRFFVMVCDPHPENQVNVVLCPD